MCCWRGEETRPADAGGSTMRRRTAGVSRPGCTNTTINYGTRGEWRPAVRGATRYRFSSLVSPD